MTEEYKYHVVERSLTQDFLLKWIWNPIVAHLPSRLKPNTITICGFLFMLASVFFIWLAMQDRTWAFIPAAILLFLYMACDNVDGPHARRTGQSSRLGEYLDHWLDSINAVALNLSVISILFLQGWLLILCLVMVAVSFFATIWEHHHTGVFHSGRMGTNEGLLLIISLYILLCFFFKNSWFTYQGPDKINIASALAYLTVIVCTITTAGILLRVRTHLMEFIPILLALISISAWVWKGELPEILAGFLILASNIPFCGRFLLKRLAKLEFRYREWVTAIYALLAIVLLFLKNSFPYPIPSTYIAYPAIFLILVTMILDAYRAVVHLGKPLEKSQTE